MRRSDLEPTNFDSDNDFGFSTYTVDEIPREKDPCEDKLKQLEKLIIPLLDKLMENPDKEIIKWPNRKSVIEKQKAKILKITRNE
jgi:hypothetical protein